jgi:glucose-6-phosphate 1-dehydrogenase
MEPGPLTLVIFGASGDLTSRKLVPSLYRLDVKKRLPPELRIVGVARSPLGDEGFRQRLQEGARAHAGNFDAAAWDAFAKRLAYVAADSAKPGGLVPLADWLKGHEGGSPGRRLFYLAVSPDLYGPIVGQLAAQQLEQTGAGGWTRLVIEKPFGRDLASARALNADLRRVFREDQLYRIDHYLGKETVQNLLVFRFANTLFEPVWNSTFIDHVQITVTESVQMEGRGSYYDRAGVLRDMFQNHLLQVLALVALEGPARFAPDPLRNEKVKVLDAVTVAGAEQARQCVCVGQYAGYRGEKGVAPNSKTPTFAAIELNIDNWRWRGVPFFLRSGKGLARRASEVVIQFRCPPHLMFPLPPGTTLQCNRLAVCLQPDEGIHLNFQSKVPDQEAMVLRPADLEFHYRTTYGQDAVPEAYERLLQDAIHGDATLFMRSDEIERAWEIMDPLIAASESPEAPQPTGYAAGSEGPTCADAFLARSGRSWLSLCRHGK